MWFTHELSRRLDNAQVTVNAVCPGFVPKTLVRHQPTAFKRFMFNRILPLMPWSRSVEESTEAMVFLATSPKIEGKSGKFFLLDTERESSEDSYNVAKARRLYDACCEWCGIEPLS